MASPNDVKDSSNRFWRYCTIGDRVEHFSHLPAVLARDAGRRWRIWHLFLQLWRESEEFVHELSSPQHRSATILFDWYRGCYQTVEERSFSGPLLKGNHPLGGTPIASKSLLDQAGSEYQKSMVRLLFDEFFVASWDTQPPDRYRDFQLSWDYRRTASIHAAAQQLALSLLLESMPSPTANLQSPSFRGPTLQACSWLADKDLANKRPVFLWDIQAKKSVETSKFSRCPPYTCISHTWGRLKKDAAAVAVETVDWLVPQVTKYKVEDLPLIFSRQKWKTKYLWFDLFCIPQDEKGKKIRDDEVSRQAIIFGQCEECIVWLNDIESSWGVVRRALQWLSAKYLVINGTPGADSFATRMLANLRNVPRANIDLLTTPLEEIPIKRYALWFSSTWTVQETFLCPNMMLVNKYWHPLSSTNGSVIPLDALINLIKYSKSGLLCADAETLDNGAVPAKQLHHWLDDTYLGSLLNPTRAGILAMGSRRQCGQSRAVAVMSVLDIVDWHAFDVKKNENPPNEAGKLIRGSYFHAFVQEAAQKIGPQFYNFISDRVEEIDAFFVNPVFGTLMPFSKGMEARFEREGSENIIAEVNGHPSVKSWIIQPDGQVRIQRVGILASIDVAGRVHFDCDSTIQFNVIPHLPGYVDLNTLLAQVSTINNEPNWFRPSYVVSLYLHEPTGMQFCTLLQGRARAKEHNAQHPDHLELVRTAILHSERYAPLPAIKDVEWLVL